MNQKDCSLLQEKDGNDFFSSRILSRNNSVGCSSRVSYYCRSPEGVPFQWETQPGTPKQPPKRDAIPTLSPPPTIRSMSLPKPCIVVDDHEKEARRSIRLKFWRKIGKYQRNKRVKEIGSGEKSLDNNTDGVHPGSNKFENLDFWSCSDRDLMALSYSPRNSSSSSMSSLSLSNGPRVDNLNDTSGREQRPGNSGISPHDAKRCFPFKFDAILVYATKRV